jgi:hypothetical protein
MGTGAESAKEGYAEAPNSLETKEYPGVKSVNQIMQFLDYQYATQQRMLPREIHNITTNGSVLTRQTKASLQ